MATMKAVRIHGYGGSEVLVYEDVPRPAVGADDLLVRVRAVSVNPIDWKIREGYLRQWLDVPMPHILGSDLAGDIVALGANVTGFQVGDAVFGMVDMNQGTNAEYVTVAHTQVAAKPRSLDYNAAATIPLCALTAWQALVEQGQLAAGQTVLIHAAAGAVGSFAVQIARLRGARVLGTASPANAAFLRDLGADEVIDYHTTPFEEVAHDVDLVLDSVGGDTQDRSWQVLKPGGLLITLLGLEPGAAAAAARGVRGVMQATRPDATQLHEIADLIDAGRIRPATHTVLPLAAARQAHDLSQSSHARGQIVLRVGED